jgi:phosphatidate cytidylyltransferase
MPLNQAVFRVRALSAVVFAAIMLTGILWNQWSFLILFLVIHTGCWWEYIRLSEQIEKIKIHNWIKGGLTTAGTGILLSFCSNSYVLAGYALGANAVLPLSLAGFILIAAGLLQKQTHITGRGAGRLGFGWLYISLSWGMMIGILEFGVNKTDLSGWLLPLLLISSIWINDTMAYIVGSYIGKTPLSPISPKKTWEGTIGGALLAVVVVSLVAVFMLEIPWVYAICLPAIGAVAGTFGDLLESKLKRMAGVKDSGQMMPGHGGFLDRFDSLLLATPIAWIFLQIFG